MRKIIVILFFLIIFSIPAYADSSRYIVKPYSYFDNISHENQSLVIDNNGCSTNLSFWDLPLWIKVAYLFGGIIAFIGALKVIPFIFGKIKNVLDLKRRNDIFTYVSDYPGRTLSQVSKEQDISMSSLRYHVNKLIAAGKLTINKAGKFSQVFKVLDDYNKLEMAVISHLGNDTRKRMLQAIVEMPGITNTELATRFNMKKSSVHWYIENFIKDGLIITKQEGRLRKYYINPSAEKILREHDK